MLPAWVVSGSCTGSFFAWLEETDTKSTWENLDYTVVKVEQGNFFYLYLQKRTGKNLIPGNNLNFAGLFSKKNRSLYDVDDKLTANPGVSNYKELELSLNRLKEQGVKVVIEANDMDKCMRLDCDHAYKEICEKCKGSNGECPKKREKRNHIRKGCLKLYEICEKLDLICKRAVWDTDDECYWQENYKGIDDWELREL